VSDTGLETPQSGQKIATDHERRRGMRGLINNTITLTTNSSSMTPSEALLEDRDDLKMAMNSGPRSWTADSSAVHDGSRWSGLRFGTRPVLVESTSRGRSSVR
jgi:hypothetical protein